MVVDVISGEAYLQTVLGINHCYDTCKQSDDCCEEMEAVWRYTTPVITRLPGESPVCGG